ncbi:hypothetical protein CCACVL1_19633 [Corchorus capsularis]|uniref:Uncharacterized protein n=1 Tax=Corchorus capsularis TaxID=210143 RepID=A0A1R3HFV7_COCAP|nr:hypothetical protein CCACVL1_19633 [Corchorus capsularis]
MSNQIILRTPASVNRRQPLLQTQSSYSFSSADDEGSNRISRRSITRKSNVKFGEVCGETTAECAAICCCCPCGLANLLVLAIYKVPAGLCRRALRQKRRRKLLKKGLLQPHSHCEFDDEFQVHPVVCLEDFFTDVAVSEDAEKAKVELENEMWNRFYGTGFWRSPSQREVESPRLKQL